MPGYFPDTWWFYISYFFGLFTYTYFFVYPKSAGPAFFESLDEAIQYATEKALPDERIMLLIK